MQLWRVAGGESIGMRAYLQTQIAVVFDGQTNDSGRATMHWASGENLQRKVDADVKGTDGEFPGYMEWNLE